jgi:hypothetical protein
MDINSTETLHGLYGSQISRNKAVGYCYHHCAALTVKTLKGHECLKKQCNALKKYEDHDYWRQREVVKERRKAKKQTSTKYYN